MYHGAWISQKLVRDINHGEYLMKKMSDEDCRDPTQTLSTLHFTYEQWDWENSVRPQYRDYCYWIKRSIIQGHPVMFATYLLYFQGKDYDHIMPAIGVRFKDEDQYDPNDVLIFFNLYHQRSIERKLNETDLIATRKTCRKHGGEGGCIPYDVSKLLFSHHNSTEFID